MATHDIGFVLFVLAVFCLFGGVLGWASWMESRGTGKKS